MDSLGFVRLFTMTYAMTCGWRRCACCRLTGGCPAASYPEADAGNQDGSTPFGKELRLRHAIIAAF